MCVLRRLICFRSQLPKERDYRLQIIYRNCRDYVPAVEAKSENKCVPCRIVSRNQLSSDISKQTSSRGVIKYQLRFFAKVCCNLRWAFFQVCHLHISLTESNDVRHSCWGTEFVASGWATYAHLAYNLFFDGFLDTFTVNETFKVDY